MGDVLKKALTKRFGGFDKISYFCVDSDDLLGNDKIAEKILQERVKNRCKDTLLFYGFRSFADLLRSEQKYPQLLVSPGIFYLKLPAAATEISKIKNRIKVFDDKISMDSNFDLMSSFAPALNALGNIESTLAHNRGNFLGAEKLLYGAYLNGLEQESYVKILKRISGLQDSYLRYQSSTPEYLLYKVIRTNYLNSSPHKLEPLKTIKVLYIDDHACLGWGYAVAYGLLLKKEKKYSEQINGPLFIENFSLNSSDIEILGFNPIHAENNYVTKLKEHLRNDLIKEYDIILLDLRLRWQEDEKLGTSEDISGFEILEHIRKINPAIPVVMLTASRRAENMERVLEKGADAYFIKESPRPGETQREIRNYHKRFVETVQQALDKAYLAEAWRLVAKLEDMSPRQCLTIDRNNLDDNLEIKWKEDIIAPLKKAIGLIKKRGVEADEIYFSWNTLGEAIINLEKPNDCIQHKNRECARLYNYNTGNFYPQFLLKGLRSIYAHGMSQSNRIINNEVKIALYFSLRLFLNSNELEDLIKKMWKDCEYIDNLQDNLHKIQEEICKLYGIENDCQITKTKNANRYTITYNNNNIQFRKNEGQTHSTTYPMLPRDLIVSSSYQNPLFDDHKNNPKYHYLLFLCNHLNRYNEFQEVDKIVCSKIYRLCGLD